MQVQQDNCFLFFPITHHQFHPNPPPDILLTIEGFNLAGKWLGKYRNITTKEPWYILTSLADLQAAVAEVLNVSSHLS